MKIVWRKYGIDKYNELRKMHVSGKFPKGHKCKENRDFKKYIIT